MDKIPRVYIIKSVVTQPTESGAVLLHQATGDCFELNHVGAEIWKLLAAGAAIETIASELARRYDVSLAVAVSDVETLVTKLIQHDLIGPERR